MKYFVIFLVLIGFAGFIPTIHAEFDESIAEPFKNNDVVLIGKVIEVNTLVSENKTEYNIQVEEYLKGQKPFDMITAVLDQTIPDDFPKDPLDYYNKPYFEKENQVFVYLKQEGGTYKISPYSFTINKPTVAGPPTVIHPTGPQGHILSQGDEIIISGNVKKGYLYGLEKSNLDSSFNLVILNEKDKLVESEKLTILPDGSYMFSFQNKGEVRIPGKYSWEITYENGGMGGEFIVETVPALWTPLKQIKSGVSLIDVKCNEGKVKVIKYNRMMVACVNGNTESETKLIDRGWALLRFALPGMTITEINHSLCNNYEGKWHPEYEGCRDISDLQCSLMGGEFVDGLKICYDGICPVEKTYTLCVTNLALVSQELENEN